MRAQRDLNEQHLQLALRQTAGNTGSSSSSSTVKDRARIEFLESHCEQLTAELQRKNQVVQHYMQREQAGAMPPESPPAPLAEPAKRRSSFASLLGKSPPRQPEVHKGVQNVLEDTLLKNMQLQRSLDLLSQELEELRRHRGSDGGAGANVNASLSNA